MFHPNLPYSSTQPPRQYWINPASPSRGASSGSAAARQSGEAETVSQPGVSQALQFSLSRGAVAAGRGRGVGAGGDRGHLECSFRCDLRRLHDGCQRDRRRLVLAASWPGNASLQR